MLCFFLYSSVKLIPFFEFCFIYGRELVFCYAEAPVSVGFAGGVEPCVASVKEQVLNRENEYSCMACKHSSQNFVVAGVPVIAVKAAVFKNFFTG